MRETQADLHLLRLSWFARAWAVAAWFHLAAEPRGTLFSQPSLAICSVLLALVASATLLRPQRPQLLVLCALILLHAWLEAPVVGNHWVLAALVSLAFCLDALVRRLLALPPAPAKVLAAARTTALVAYSFAAFAKLNWDFINPAVSCVVFFQERMVSSWGLPGLGVGQWPAVGHALALITIAVELSVAALLAFPQSRRYGLALAFGFHWVLALDLNQHFWDFSSVLFAVYLLFLDSGQVRWIDEQLRPLERYRPAPGLSAALVIAAGLGVGAMNVLPTDLDYRAVLAQLGHTAWWLYGTVLMVLVLACLWAPRAQQSDTAGQRLPAWLWVAPVLAALNGLTPYLELKTGFGWNMYSNLRTVAGQTNHMLLPATWDLTGAQRDLVQIVRSADPALRRLHDDHYALTFSEFREYAHRFPQSEATYLWKGEIHTAPRLGDDPVGQQPVGVLAAKLASFRVVDLQPQERCQPSFSPAR